MTKASQISSQQERSGFIFGGQQWVCATGANFGIQKQGRCDHCCLLQDIPLLDGRNIMPLYVVRRLGGEREELPCFLQLEDEGAAMYFNIVHGRKVRRRFTTERVGDKCTDYVLVARESGTGGFVEEREISLFNLTSHGVRLM